MPISGVGGLNADGQGTLELDALFANTYSGDTNVSGGGTLVLDNVQGPAVPGNLFATGTGTIVRTVLPEQIGDSSDVVIDNGATLNVGFIPGPGTTETIGTLDVDWRHRPGRQRRPAHHRQRRPQWRCWQHSVVILPGTGTLVANGPGQFDGNIFGTGTFDLRKAPVSRSLTGVVAPNVQVIVSGGELQDDGNIQGTVTVQNGATLGGSGQVQGLVTVLGGGTIDCPAGGGTRGF